MGDVVLRRGSQDFRGAGATYRMGYATSRDLATWVREDARAGIEPSPEGWDSQMIAYPNVIQVGDRCYMFYNGNGFGQSGFGVAVLEGTS